MTKGLTFLGQWRSTKASMGKFNDARKVIEDEWEITRNKNGDYNKRDSIWFG